MDFRILKRKLEIGKRIDDFLDNVSESGLLFKLGVDNINPPGLNLRDKSNLLTIVDHSVK